MRLTTVQPHAVVAKLMAGECVSGQPVFDLQDGCDANMKRAYDWLVQQMAKCPRLGLVVAGAYPMWAWAVPPASVEAFIPMTSEPSEYILHLDVPDLMVMVTDYDMWHHVLNDHSIQLYEDEEVKTEPSWHRVFGVDPYTYSYTLTSPDPHYMSLDCPPTIQATLWHIDPRWIVSIEAPHVSVQEKQ